MVLTDSGGIQEETTVLDIPCLTIRENTERPITITQGTNILVGTDERKIVEEATKILRGERKRRKTLKYWDGRAAGRIVKVLARK
jgi:UDP-N-acetylglucosamine 2-epimerase (non-hydrolysing)